jgi:hypothetical protein
LALVCMRRLGSFGACAVQVMMRPGHARCCLRHVACHSEPRADPHPRPVPQKGLPQRRRQQQALVHKLLRRVRRWPRRRVQQRRRGAPAKGQKNKQTNKQTNKQKKHNLLFHTVSVRSSQTCESTDTRRHVPGPFLGTGGHCAAHKAALVPAGIRVGLEDPVE